MTAFKQTVYQNKNYCWVNKFNPAIVKKAKRLKNPACRITNIRIASIIMGIRRAILLVG